MTEPFDAAAHSGPGDWTDPRPGQQYPAAPQWGEPDRQYDPSQSWTAQPHQPWTGEQAEPVVYPTAPPPAAPAHPRAAMTGRPWSLPGAHTAEQPAAARLGSSRAAWKPILLGVGAVAAVVAAVVPAASLLNAETLDRHAAQQGVRQVLTGNYGVPNVGDVSCPAAIKVKVDSTFTCTAQIDGDPRPVTARFVSSDGTYEVDRPQ
jgi:hypothetical protein